MLQNYPFFTTVYKLCGKCSMKQQGTSKEEPQPAESPKQQRQEPDKVTESFVEEMCYPVI